MTREQRLKRTVLWGCLWTFLILIGCSWLYISYAIPDHLNLVVSEEEVFDFPLPLGVTFESECEEVVLGNASDIPAGQVKIQSVEPVRLYGTAEGNYRIGMKWLGLIRLKDIQVDVVTDRYAIPCGTPIGIYLRSNGVMVIGTGEIVSSAGQVVEPALGTLKTGDYIETVNGQELEDKSDLIAAVNASGGDVIHMDVRRNGEMIAVDMNPVQAEDGSYKLGAWVRDDTQGIGTVTYVDMNGSFGALGHGISDSDTGRLVDAKGGELYRTEILGIEKGMPGNPGVMSGMIYYGPGTKMGEVSSNTEEGIFGTVNARFMETAGAEAIPIGFRQDVKKGNAVIRSSVSGEVKDYAIEIQKVDHAAIQKNKGMTIKVVDEELLELTGGIVQGMSGSPVIQNGRIVGAVTHVLVNDPTRGYGIFIENMLEAAK